MIRVQQPLRVADDDGVIRISTTAESRWRLVASDPDRGSQGR